VKILGEEIPAPSIETFKKKVLNCDYLDMDQGAKLCEFLDGAYLPLLILGQYKNFTLKLSPATRQLQPRDYDAENDVREIAHEDFMLGININVEPHHKSVTIDPQPSVLSPARQLQPPHS